MMEAKEIIDQNPWWRIKNWQEFDKHLLMLQDSPFRISRTNIGRNQINLIYGPRQVGKTTFLKLTIKRLLQEGVPSGSIAYFSCDSLLSNERGELRKVIEFLLERGIAYLFIDEISNVKGWEYEIKYFADAGKLDLLTVFITGSPFGMKEYLPGRKINHFYLMPITFREFLLNLASNLTEMTEKTFNIKRSEIEEIKELANILPGASYDFTSFHGIEKETMKIEPYSRVLEKLFSFYILTGGFPSVISGFIRYGTDGNKLHLLEEIKTNKERLIDSLRKAGKNDGICFQLINAIKKKAASRYSFTELKETEIDLSKETIINYLGHLKNTFLLKIIYAYDFGNMDVGWKKSKKIYLLDPFLYHEERILDNVFDEEYASKIVESVVCITLAYLREDFLNPVETFLHFWYNSKEIDFILNGKLPFAIEVKFKRKAEGGYKISQIKNYFVLTKDTLKFTNEEIFVPACLFLALLKSKEAYL